MMHVLFHDPRFPEGPDEALARMEALSIDGVFMNSDPGMIQAQEIALAAKRHHLTLAMLHLPFRPDANAIYEASPAGDAFMASLDEALSFAISHEIPAVVMHYGSHVPPEENEIFQARFTSLLSRAQDAGIAFCLENLRDTARLVTLFDEHQESYPLLSLCFDAGHAQAFTHDLASFPFAHFAGRIRGIHLHDNDGQHDLHQTPFAGVIDFAYVMKELKCAGYRGPLTFECMHKNSPEGSDAQGYMENVARAFERMEELWNNA